MVLGLSLKTGEESKQGSAGTTNPVTGSVKGYIVALNVNP